MKDNCQAWHGLGSLKMYLVWDKSYTMELDCISKKYGYESKRTGKKTTKLEDLASHETTAANVFTKKKRTSPEANTQKK